MFEEVPALQLARKDGCGVCSGYTGHQHSCFREVLTGPKVFTVSLRKSILTSRKGEVWKTHRRSVASY